MKSIVFDNAGTILRRCTVLKDMLTNKFIFQTNTIGITIENNHRVIVVFQTPSKELIQNNCFISQYMKDNMDSFEISYNKINISKEELIDVLTDDKTHMNHIKDVSYKLIEEYDIEICSGSALIIDTKLGRIDYVYTAGGVFFDGVRPLINYLQENDYEIYIASGDNKDSLVKIAECLKIPQDNVFDTQNADGKKEIVKSLQTDHDVVYMVGNHCNDYLAIKQADIGILSLEQKEKVPSKLINKADYVVDSISDVLKIVKEEEN